MSNARVYRLAKGWRVFVLLTMPPLIILAFVAAALIFTEDIPIAIAISISLICVGLALLMGWGLYDMLISKWIINDKGIVAIRRDKTRRVGLKNFDSFRIDQNYLILYSNKPSVRRLKISVYVNDFNKLREWANANFIDLDLALNTEDEARILENNDYGLNERERIANLKRTKKICRWLNVSSVILAITLFVVPYYREIQILILCIWPLIALLYARIKKGLIPIGIESKGISNSPSLLVSLIVPMLILGIIGTTLIDVVDHENVWPWMASFTSIPILLVAHRSLWPYHWKKERFLTSILSLLFIIPIWAYGSVIVLNEVFSSNDTQWYKTTVVNSRESYNSKGPNSFYFELAPFGTVKDTIEIKVSSEQFNQTQEGDTVDVWLETGFFEIPYAGIGN